MNKLQLLIVGALTTVPMMIYAQGGDLPYFDGAQDEASVEVMKQAAVDIERYRKGDFELKLVDSQSGESIEASANVELVDHKFEFGVSLHRIPLQDDVLKMKAYDALDDIFNKTTVCDYFSSWNYSLNNSVSNEQNLNPAMENIAFSQKNDMRMRFHAVLYNLPMWLNGRGWSEEEFWQMFEDRIKYVADNYGELIDEYDVINETVFWHGDFYDANPGYPDFNKPEMAKRAFELTRKYLPTQKLVALEASVVSTTNKTFLRTIDHHKGLIDAGVDYDYVGFQGHFFYQDWDYRQGREDTGANTFTMASISGGLDLLRDLGKPVIVTEFNGPSRFFKTNYEIGLRDPRDEGIEDPLWSLSEEENADWQINFYRLVFSKPYIHQLTRWFAIDGLGGPALDGGILTMKGEKHAIYEKLKHLIKEEWHTDYSGVSNKRGELSFRGFYGDYSVDVDGYESASVELNEAGEYIVKLNKR